jgi:hypothetical protein
MHRVLIGKFLKRRAKIRRQESTSFLSCRQSQLAGFLYFGGQLLNTRNDAALLVERWERDFQCLKTIF